MRALAGRIFRSLHVVCLLVLASAGAMADVVHVAVAANFAATFERLAVEFEADSPHRLNVTVGSTGLLFAQISHGAPFDVLLAADQRRPSLLEQNGLAVRGSRFTYATGRLTLWSRDARLVVNGPRVLASTEFRRLAIANPELAPYGAAAIEVLKALGRYEQIADRLVLGENIGQAYAMVATGNAELGMVALSHVVALRDRPTGSRWDVPANLHAPIRQDAVLLSRAEEKSAARDVLAYLRRAEVRALISESGYGVE